MSTSLLVAIGILVVLLMLGGAYFFLTGSQAGSGGASAALLQSGRTSTASAAGAATQSGAGASLRGASLSESAAATTAKTSGKMTLIKRLKYAQWTIPPASFRIAQIAVSLIVMGALSVSCEWFVVAYGALAGPIICNAILGFCVNRRFKKFDKDYPAFLLSVCALLKTGMNAIGGLEAAAKGLSEDSMLRQEVEMMIERLRLGVPEDRSIGEFGSDIAHPEIELFVQAILLSRKVGGTLSDTLERLSKQVRKRQFFRESAQAAVGLQRGSIWVIIGILMLMEIYLYFSYPESVVDAIKDPTGWFMWQIALSLILTGLLWMRQVTKIKV